MNTKNLRAWIDDTKKKPWVVAALAVIAVFVFLRIWRLHLPAETVFDEVYFPKMASQYLAGEKFFDIHPPLGKLIIAVGEIIFGNTTFGWRIMPLLAGIAIIPAAYWVMVKVFKNQLAGLIAALLFAIDGLMIVYSRTGLMDGFITLFGLLSIGFCWWFIDRRNEGEQAWSLLLLTGVFAGLAVAVKWIGAGFLPLTAFAILITMYLGKKRRFEFNDFFIWVIAFAVIPFVLYTLPFLANWQTNFWNEFATWHQQSWGYNVNLDATHPYASKWWSWPFLVRPIWFYYKGDAGNVIGVDAIGNPAVWWGATLAVVYTVIALIYSALVWRRKESQILTRNQFWALLFVLGGWAAFYLPWTQIGRVLFLYHYMSSYLFALLLTGFWLSYSVLTKRGIMAVIGLIAVAIVVALMFAPIWIAYPIPQEWFNRLMWFKSWI